MRISGLRVRTIYIKEDFQRVDSNQLRVYSVRKYAFNLESCASINKDPGKFAELLNGWTAVRGKCSCASTPTWLADGSYYESIAKSYPYFAKSCPRSVL